MAIENFFYGVISEAEVDKAEKNMSEVISNSPFDEQYETNFDGVKPSLTNKIKALIYWYLLRNKPYRKDTVKALEKFILR